MTEKRKRELLQQYITGKISPKNRHALEREAIDDVFLFEALEGYSKHMKSPDLPFYKTKPNTVLPIRTFMTMAASFLAIAAIAFLVKQNINSTVNEEAISQMEAEPIVNKEEIVSVENPDKPAYVDPSPKVNKTEDLREEIIEKSEKPYKEIVKGQENISHKSVKKTEAKQHVESKSKTTNIETVVTTESQDLDILNSKAENSSVQDLGEDTLEEQLDDQEVDSRKAKQAERPSSVIKSESQNKMEQQTEEFADSILENKDSIQNIAKEKVLEINNGTGDTLESRIIFEEFENQIPMNQGMIYVSELPHKNSKIELSGGATGPAPSSGRVIPGIRYSPEEVVAADSLHSYNYRKVYPVVGWNVFSEELDQLKKQVSCQGMSFTFKFKILESGYMYDLELTQLPSIDQTGLVLECLVKTKAFIEGYDKWETIPSNRKVNRKLTIDFDE